MESVRREPVPVLRSLVHHYHGFLLPDVADRARLEIPSGAVTLLIAFAEPIRIGDGLLNGSNRSAPISIEYW